MLIESFIQTYSNLGIILAIDPSEDCICWDAPKGVVTEDHKKELKLHKTEIISYLKQKQLTKDKEKYCEPIPQKAQPFLLNTKQADTVRNHDSLEELTDEQKLKKPEELEAFLKNPSEEDNTPLPSEWKESIETLLTRQKPECFNKVIWANINLQVKELSKSSFLKRIVQHGWSLKDIFGCHPTHPNQRYDYMGLLMLLEAGHKTVHDVTKEGIILKTHTGAFQTCRRFITPIPDQITLMDLEEEQGNNIPQPL
jgi:hypothetical protein